MRIGPYEVLGELARGGMGVVYRARDPGLGREVALKVLKADGAARPASLARFQREAETLGRLRHPSLLPVHASGVHDGRPYLVLPLVAGASLAERLRVAGPLAPRAAADLGARLADALAHAHAAGVLHRDVKPDNVLVAEDGTPLLTDFGLAKDELAADSLSRSGVPLGTPGYWSPEQAAGDRAAVGPATDVYSLGATLYALLTGRQPFRGDSLQEVVAATLRAPPTPASAIRAEVDRELDAVVLTCLAKDPADRYADAAPCAPTSSATCAASPSRRGRGGAPGAGPPSPRALCSWPGSAWPGRSRRSGRIAGASRRPRPATRRRPPRRPRSSSRPGPPARTGPGPRPASGPRRSSGPSPSRRRPGSRPPRSGSTSATRAARPRRWPGSRPRPGRRPRSGSRSPSGAARSRPRPPRPSGPSSRPPRGSTPSSPAGGSRSRGATLAGPRATSSGRPAARRAAPRRSRPSPRGASARATSRAPWPPPSGPSRSGRRRSGRGPYLEARGATGTDMADFRHLLEDWAT